MLCGKCFGSLTYGFSSPEGGAILSKEDFRIVKSKTHFFKCSDKNEAFYLQKV
ncbi:hypothetical protein LEP1GSC016_3928 [Leptospira borgpetersenii serovar Hardjo-bovis str. Sponselee]|uniref:Uncharacterized protein n=1 Tax=Leptospira borgpetersenii serovar Hardjo-bovis str. Sponselee TaxID=1303729 RepID=M6BDE8_LEPBO|nr:hypothetical protein LEP1GSC016_3928 [Leptospira borgpetersenii serovar Hardjo-bovis str. Sponselee]